MVEANKSRKGQMAGVPPDVTADVTSSFLQRAHFLRPEEEVVVVVVVEV